MLRRLRVLAAFFCLPVAMVFATSPAASAAGPWTTIHTVSNVLPGAPDWTPDGTDCWWNIRNTIAGELSWWSVAAGYCLGAPDTTPGSTQPGESGEDFGMTFTGTDELGSECTGTHSGTLTQHPSNGTLQVAGTIPAGQFTMSSAGCTITRVCINWEHGGPFIEGCTDTNAPPDAPEEPPTSACPYGTPETVSATWEFSQHWTSYQDQWNLVVTAPDVQPGTGYGADAEGWNTAVWIQQGTGPVGPAAYDRDGFKTSRKLPFNSDRHEWEGESDPPTNVKVYGVEVYYIEPSPAPLWNEATGGGQHDGEAAYAASEVPTGPSSNFGGISDPARCRFYFGTTLATTGTEMDDPDGPVVHDDDPELPEEPPPPLPDPDPEPEPDPDENWLSLIWGVLVAIKNFLWGIANWLKGLVSSLLDGFRSMLRGLFLPGNGYLEDQWSSVDSAWDDTTPAKYVDTFASFSPGTVAGCSGVPLDVTLPGGVQVSENLGAACSGSMANAAGIVRAALTAFVVVGGAIACVRALGSGLGWNPGVGRADG